MTDTISEAVENEDHDDSTITEIVSNELADSQNVNQTNINPGAILNIPVEMMVSVGAAQIKLKDLSQMGRDSVFPLNTRINDPVKVLVNGQTIALGMLEENEEDSSIQVRITQIFEQ